MVGWGWLFVWGSAFFVVVVYDVCYPKNSAACVRYTYMFVRWCVDIILIQARYLFEFKNLTAICFHAARWISIWVAGEGEGK